MYCNEIEKNVVKFITKHHVMTIATISTDGFPRTANLFYAYDKESNSLIFTSSLSTAHGADMVRSARVGANIVLETSKVGCIEGLQIEGTARRAENEELSFAKRAYVTRFPFAMVADLELWILRIDFLKMTDNKLGFGKKIVWARKQSI